MLRTIRFFQALILVVWLGGMIFFSLVVAPAAFRVLPSAHAAGILVSAVLRQMNYLSVFSLILFIGLCVMAPVTQKQNWNSRGHLLAGFAAMALLISLYAGWGIDRRLHTLRTEVGAIDALATDNPVRQEFDRLHRRSVILFGTKMGIGLLMLGIWMKDQ